MIKIKNAALCVAFLAFTISSLYSQSESVILYNSKAVKVQLSDAGKILSFTGEVPGYMEGYDVQTKSIETAPVAIAETIKPAISTSKNAEYKIVSTEREELKYKPNFATLDKVVIDKLNEIAAKLTRDPNAKILLTAHTSSTVRNKLTKNRLDSAITYLGIKGILSYRIQTEIQKSDIQTNVIEVNYLN